MAESEKPATGPRLADYVAAEVRKLDPDRWLTALFAPDAIRDDLLALYAFNLEVARIPEQVREPALGDIRLQWWRDALRAAFASNAPRGHPVAEALERAIRSHDLPQALFERLLDARAADFAEPPARLEDLEAYAESTAASLSALALKVLGANDEPSARAARAVAIAFALTGLIRAVPFHAAQRRLYLPQALLEAEGVKPETIFSGDVAPMLRRVVRPVAERAEFHLAEARTYRGRAARAALPALLPATLAQLYLARLKRADYDPMSPRLAIGMPRKQVRLLISAGLSRF